MKRSAAPVYWTSIKFLTFSITHRQMSLLISGRPRQRWPPLCRGCYVVLKGNNEGPRFRNELGLRGPGWHNNRWAFKRFHRDLKGLNIRLSLRITVNSSVHGKWECFSLRLFPERPLAHSVSRVRCINFCSLTFLCGRVQERSLYEVVKLYNRFIRFNRNHRTV